MYQGFSGVLFIGRKITVTLYLVYENENSCHKKKGNVSTTKQCPGLNQTTKKQHCTVSTKSNRWGLDLCSVFSDTPKVTLPHPTTAWMQSHSKSMQNCTSLRSDKPKQKKKGFSTVRLIRENTLHRRIGYLGTKSGGSVTPGHDWLTGYG